MFCFLVCSCGKKANPFKIPDPINKGHFIFSNYEFFDKKDSE
jgi:hypothetical protein